MNNQELIEFRRSLLAWFFQSRRDLPWRQNRDPYRIWLSEIMLQQTRVAVVVPYYERFLEKFPSVQSLAAAPEEEILRAWSGLGYYSRARNLQKAAQQILAVHGGEFPKTWEETLALPGIGAYTAAAILSIAFGEKRAVLDGNVARVLARIGAVRGDLREGKRWQALQRTADELLDQSTPGDWNQAMMELGATICTPRAPQCLLCPVSNFCRSRKTGWQDRLPEKRRKRASVEVNLVTAVFLNGQGETLLLPPPKTARKKTADDVTTLVSGMWHFPTESAQDDLAQTLNTLVRRHSKASAILPEALRQVRHAVTYRKVKVFPFRIALGRLPRIPGAKKVPLGEVSAMPVSNLTRKIVRSALA